MRNKTPPPPKEAKEGIKLDDTTDRYISVSEMRLYDLLCEGEIEGLVKNEYVFSGTEGNIGWTSVNVKPYQTFELPMSEAEGDSPPAPLFSWLRSVYWNEVPVLNSDGKLNFQRISVIYTTGLPNGSVSELDGDPINLTSTRYINERLRGSNLDLDGNPTSDSEDYFKYYRILNKDCRGVIVNIAVQSLQKSDPKTGDILEHIINYNIYYRPIYSSGTQDNDGGFSDPISEKIEGKITQGYIRSTKIDFEEAPLRNPSFIGWEIKIARLTQDSSSSYVSGNTFVESLTEVYENSFSYPNCAMVRSVFNAEFFRQAPVRAYDLKMLKIKLPKNYDPLLKQYSTTGPGTTNGAWNGEFHDTKYWSDNPAWCFYDLLTNRRYGLGKYIPENYVDKFTLYKIGQYCDTLVPDGYGGLEPRFTCNIIMNSREEAFRVLNDFASIFNSIIYYASGSIFVSQDRPKNPVAWFNNSNVKDGNFSYSSSSKTARHTVAYVRYNDPKDFFKPALEYCEHIDGIRKYGIRPIEITAIGCASKGQARRLGMGILETENLETEMATFTSGLEATKLRPGDIFGIFDRFKKTQEGSGRIDFIDYDGGNIEISLDRRLVLESGVSYKLLLTTPGFEYDSDVDAVTSDDFDSQKKSFVQELTFVLGDIEINEFENSTIIIPNTLDEDNFEINNDCVWVIQKDAILTTVNDSGRYPDKNYDYFRVINIEEKDGEYQISALQYNELKFSETEKNLKFERDPDIVSATPDPPTDLSLEVVSKTNNSKIILYSFVPPNDLVGITSYKVFVKNGAFDDANLPSNSLLHATLPFNVYDGTYIPYSDGTYFFRIYSFNDEVGVYSATYLEGSIQVANIMGIRDVTISNLEVENGTLINQNDFPFNFFTVNELEDPYFRWQVGLKDDALPPSNFGYRITFRPPSELSIPSSDILLDVVGLTNTNYNLDFQTNLSLPGGPYTHLDVVVEAIDAQGNTSAGNTVIPGEGGTTGENGWTLNAEGYDRINVKVAGATSLVELTETDLTLGDLNDNNKKYRFIDFNGGVNFIFPDGYIDDGMVGGFIYASKNQFSISEIINEYPDLPAGVISRQFEYNTIENWVHAQSVFNPHVNSPSGCVALAFVNRFGLEKLNAGTENPGEDFVFSTNGISAISSPIYADGAANKFWIKNSINFNDLQANQGDNETSLKVNRIGDDFEFLAENNSENVIIMSKKL